MFTFFSLFTGNATVFLVRLSETVLPVTFPRWGKIYPYLSVCGCATWPLSWSNGKSVDLILIDCLLRWWATWATTNCDELVSSVVDLVRSSCDHRWSVLLRKPPMDGWLVGVVPVKAMRQQCSVRRSLQQLHDESVCACAFQEQDLLLPVWNFLMVFLYWADWRPQVESINQPNWGLLLV